MASKSIDLMGLAGLVLVVGISVLARPAIGLDPAPKCEAAKLDASAKEVRCTANLSSRAIRKASAVDSARLAKCSSRFEEGFTKSELRAAGACPTDGDAAFVGSLLDACIDGVVTDLGGVPGAGGAQARCQSAKVNEAGKYAQCLFKAAAKAVKKGEAPDPTKCSTKVTGRWARIESKYPCLTSGDLSSVTAAIDGCYAAAAASLAGACGNGSLDAGEECDDANTTSGDGCSALCTAEAPSPSRLAATATASSSGPAGGPHLAVDGNLTTRWESAHGVDPSSITLDLGAGYSLSEVILHWEAANAATYEIQGSADNSYWTTLSSQTGGVFGDRTDVVAVAGIYRYVRMKGLTRTSPYGYSIWEMEVYGSPAPDADGDGVDDSLDLCPGTPSGSTVDADGCVFLDADNDGVGDDLDQCPGTPPLTRRRYRLHGRGSRQ